MYYIYKVKWPEGYTNSYRPQDIELAEVVNTSKTIKTSVINNYEIY